MMKLLSILCLLAVLKTSAFGGATLSFEAEYDAVVRKDDEPEPVPRKSMRFRAVLEPISGALYWKGDPIVEHLRDGGGRVYVAEVSSNGEDFKMLLQQVDPGYLESGEPDILGEMALTGPGVIEWFSEREILALGLILQPGNYPISRYGKYKDLLNRPADDLPDLMERTFSDTENGMRVTFANTAVEVIDVDLEVNEPHPLVRSIRTVYTHPHGHYTREQVYTFDSWRTLMENGTELPFFVPTQVSYSHRLSKNTATYEDYLVVNEAVWGTLPEEYARLVSEEFLHKFPDTVEVFRGLGWNPKKLY